MTKKRFKFGLAILGGMAAFLLALLALVFVPTLASAGKGPVFGQDQDGGSHNGHPNPAYFQPPTGGGNNSNHSQGGGNPCADNPCDTSGASGEEPWFHPGSGPGNDQGDNHGNGHPSSNDSGNNPQGGQGNPPGFFAGGAPWGGGGGGTPNDQSGSCSSAKDDTSDDDKKAGDQSGEKTCDKNDDDKGHDGDNDGGIHRDVRDDKGSSDGSSGGSTSGNTQDTSFTADIVNNDLPTGDDTDGDLPPDPNCFPFGEGCGPQGGNPPNTGLTNETTDIPEPLTLSLFAAGLAGTAVLRRRSRRKASVLAD